MVGPLVLTALPQIKRDLEKIVASNSLDISYADITNNTTRPFKVPSSMTATKIHTLFTGPNLRWEILGLLFTISCLNAQFASPHDPLFTVDGSKKVNKDEFIWK